MLGVENGSFQKFAGIMISVAGSVCMVLLAVSLFHPLFTSDL